ncbi:aldehyde ferredoxin oxidoreductase N-terminal domain-containing protein [Chloroflexota bacterium]
MSVGYRGKILTINLDSGEVGVELLPDSLYRDYIGGVGLGVKLLYDRQRGGVDALSEENILGFMPGLLSGTIVPCSSRLTVVSKSPLTGGWGDSSVGGHIAYELKCAGYDGIFFWGISPKPVYLLIYKDNVQLRDASHLWGLDTTDTENKLRGELEDNKLRIASIGPSGESMSLIASITSDKRAAARSGLGAVMGSKRLKAIAIHNEDKVPVADLQIWHSYDI